MAAKKAAEDIRARQKAEKAAARAEEKVNIIRYRKPC